MPCFDLRLHFRGLTLQIRATKQVRTCAIKLESDQLKSTQHQKSPLFFIIKSDCTRVFYFDKVLIISDSVRGAQLCCAPIRSSPWPFCFVAHPFSCVLPGTPGGGDCTSQVQV